LSRRCHSLRLWFRTLSTRHSTFDTKNGNTITNVFWNKLRLFSSDGKAGMSSAPSYGASDIEMITKLVAEEVAKYLKK